MKKVTIKKTLLATASISIALVLTGCGANQGLQTYNINDAMKNMPASVKAKTGDFKFYFNESAGLGSKNLGPIKTSNRTNAAGKSALTACNWVFYSALLDLKQQAQQMGGDAVANIHSNWKNNKTKSSTTFVCENGLWLTGVALTGEAVNKSKL